MRPIKDKGARLRVAGRYITSSVVKFPRKGCQQLLTQRFGFGSEKRDGAGDAVVYLILGLVVEVMNNRRRITFEHTKVAIPIML